MADIDKITASNGTTYNIKDSTARESISQSLGITGELDLNTLKTTGIYYCYTNSSNKPSNTGGMLIVAASETHSSVCQLFVESSSSAPRAYARLWSSSTWSSWNQV